VLPRGSRWRGCPRVALRPGAESLEPRLHLSAVRLGPELSVNTITDQDQSRPAVAADGAGRFVVAWQSAGQDGSGLGVYARRFGADGSALEHEFPVNAHKPSDQSRPSVAAAAAGGFVIVWQSQNEDGSGIGVFGQLYNADGDLLDAQFLVNTITDGHQALPAVAMAPDGRFVVAWVNNSGKGWDIFARVYTRDARPLGSAFPVNTNTFSGTQLNPSVGMAADGRFVVAWSGTDSESTFGVFARRYAADGNALAEEFLVSPGATPEARKLSVAVEPDGDFVVAWETMRGGEAGYDVHARRYAADGVSRGDAFPVNTHTAANQTAPAVAVAGDGGFVVAWESEGQDGEMLGVYARQFGADGLPIGGETAVNTYIPDSQSAPAVALAPGGRFIVAWHSKGQDGDGDGVYAQRFGPEPPADPPAISVGDVMVTEGDAGAAEAAFTLTLSGARTYPVTVRYATRDSTAVAPADYAATSGTLTFAPAQTSATVVVPVAGDVLDEADETFSLLLSEPINATLAVTSATAWIIDNDPLPVMIISDAAQGEGDSGDRFNLVFDVTLSAPSGREVRAAYVTGVGPADTATRDVDYQGAAGVVTFAPGQTTATIPIPTIGDSWYEGIETFTLRLAPDGTQPFTMGDGEAVGSIWEDDAAPALTVEWVEVVEGNDPAGQWVNVPFRLSTAAGVAVTLDYATADDQATTPADYASAAGTLTFAPGETEKVIQVRVFGDAVEEPIEAFWIRLSNVRNAVGEDGRVAIHDDDAQLPTVTGVFVAGSSWTAAFRQRLSDPSGLRIEGGAAQLDELPWTGIDQVSIRFNREVIIHQPNLVVRGATGAEYPTVLVSRDPTGLTCTWTLARPLAADRYTLRLASARTPDGAQDARTGALLDGEWSNGADTFPSGDGVAGGDFVFRFNVLPGDVTRDGAVSAADLSQVRARHSTSAARVGAGTATYSLLHDVDGSGRIDVFDYARVRGRLFSALPPEPAGAASRPLVSRGLPPRRELFSSVSI
jgi:hypothetical protein